MKNRKLFQLKYRQQGLPGKGALHVGPMVDWSGLVKGVSITVTTAAGEKFVGVVDQVTSDGLVLWVHLERGQGRRLFVFNDVSQTTVAVQDGQDINLGSSGGHLLASL